MMSEERMLREIQRRREAERRNDEREERERLREARLAKARDEKENRPEVYWIKRLCWALWIFTGVECLRAMISIWPR